MAAYDALDRFWVLQKPMFEDSDSSWPPANFGSNSSTQHLSLHCQMENDPKLTSKNPWGNLTDVDDSLGHNISDTT